MGKFPLPSGHVCCLPPDHRLAMELSALQDGHGGPHLEMHDCSWGASRNPERRGRSPGSGPDIRSGNDVDFNFNYHSYFARLVTFILDFVNLS
jgi:hypothetical protein